MYRQIQRGAHLKYGNLEIIGKDISDFEVPLNSGGGTYERRVANKKILAARHEFYRTQKNIFLVHRTKPTDEFHLGTGLRYYDLSIYLTPHKIYGALNDVKRVEYYLGEHFGKSKSNYGAEYLVTNSLDGFAIKTRAYGPTLCEAKVFFHDGTEVTMHRYIDFESVGFRYDPNFEINKTSEGK